MAILIKGLRFTGRTAVWLALFVVIIFMTADAANSIALVINPSWHVYKGNVPMDIVSWFWCAILGAYTIGFQFLQIMETRSLPEGEISLGDTERLKKLMFAALFAALYGLALNVFFNANIALEGLVSAFLTDVLCYVIGRRAIETQKFHDGGVDINGDGSIDDSDDENHDGVIDWKDVQLSYKNRGIIITEAKAKNIINTMFKNVDKYNKSTVKTAESPKEDKNESK